MSLDGPRPEGTAAQVEGVCEERRVLRGTYLEDGEASRVGQLNEDKKCTENLIRKTRKNTENVVADGKIIRWIVKTECEDVGWIELVQDVVQDLTFWFNKSLKDDY